MWSAAHRLRLVPRRSAVAGRRVAEGLRRRGASLQAALALLLIAAGPELELWGVAIAGGLLFADYAVENWKRKE